MGRLQALIVTVAFAGLAASVAACDDAKPVPAPPTNKRSDIIVGSGTAPTATTRATVSAQPVASVPAKARALCPGPSLNRAMPSEKLGHAEAAGAAALGDTLPVGNGRWTWISLWAAWCAPCKEEMPRLLKWQTRLATSLAVQFVSLDDDERQLLRFLESQPATGVRATFWLPDGSGREAWLGSMRLKTSPQLPVQVLVNPQGRVHCIIEGAVEDGDFAQVASIVGQR